MKSGEAIWIHRLPKGDFEGTTLHGPRRPYRPGLANVLLILAVTDFRARYRGQALGLVWSLLYPLAMMTMMTVVFRRVARIEVAHYPVFVLIGIVYWQLCTRAWSQATRVFVTYGGVGKRATFPRYLMPLAAVMSFGFGFVIESVLVFCFALIFSGSLTFGWAWLALPIVLALLFCMLAGLALASATLFAFFRDIAFIVETGMLFLYWATPILYPIESLPPHLRPIVELNPFGALLVTLRFILMAGKLPDANYLLLDLAFPVVALLIGWLVFRSHATRLADQL